MLFILPDIPSYFLNVQMENANHKKKVMELEDEVTKLSGQQNLQQRIHHHAKIKARVESNTSDIEYTRFTIE